MSNGSQAGARPVNRTVTFIHHPSDFPSQWVAKEEKGLLDQYTPAARKHGLKYEFLPSHRVVPFFDGRPRLLVDGIDVLEQRSCFLLEQMSADPQADQFLRSIYEVIAGSDSLILNRTTQAPQRVELDKLAIANRAAALGIPHVPTLVVPPGKYARMAIEHLPILNARQWILKPRELSMGRAVLRIETEELLRAALDMVAQSGISYIIQPYTPNEGDLRVYMIEGEAFAALVRRAKSGGYVANVSQGGSVEYVEPPLEAAQMSKRICDDLDARYLCVDWLITKDGYVLNEWCTTLGGFNAGAEKDRERMADRFFQFLASEIERAELTPARGGLA